MPKNLVIVESPAKAKTLKKFLGSNYKIEASVGHVRDLPKSELGIDVDNDFEPKYITIRGKGDILSKLRKEAKNSDRIYLATDPDREGEAISWHLMQALKLDHSKTMRITFNEITKSAVTKSIKQARDIDNNLVDAQQARRALDRILGYKISPLLWKKVKKGLSAGRVQSVALKMICDREDEIQNFIPEEYWTLDVVLASGKESFTAKYNSNDNNKVELKTEEQVNVIVDAIKDKTFTVSEIKTGTRHKKPVPPFTTSTMQQEASKLLGYTAQKIMSLAQQLYEGVEVKGKGSIGLVTYIRTDSVRISDEAYEQAKTYIKTEHGDEYLNPERPEYKSKGRSQDAHEAIRPSYPDLTPEEVMSSLSKDQYKLYKLIWERFIASQMSPAVYDTLNVKLACGTYVFRATGSILRFPGYLTIYKKNEEADDDVKIPKLEQGAELKAKEYKPAQHFTSPPPRFTEANLVKTMEELGIGRPSTYAATITNIVSRGYVSKESKVFYPTELGEIVNDIMSENFSDIVDIDFTAKMEDDLDKVEDGEMGWKSVMHHFYGPFKEQLDIAEQNIGDIEVADEKTDILCENCGRNMVIKFGKFGKFLACPGFPECKNAKPLLEEAGMNCPRCNAKVMIKKSKKGRKYYGCERNPECDFMSWDLPTGEICPACGGFLVEKGTKKRRVVCANAQCKYEKLE